MEGGEGVSTQQPLLLALAIGLAIAPALALTAQRAAFDTTGLVLLMHLDEAAAPLRDTSGEEAVARVHSAALGRPGRLGKAIELNGQDQYVQVEETYCYSEQTILLWAKASPAKQVGSVLSSQQQPGRSSWRWRISRNPDRTVSFHLWDGSLAPKQDRTAKSRSPMPDDQWCHIAVTVDTTRPKQAVLYLNGRREAATEVRSHQPYGSLFIGTGTFEGFFAGAVDEVAMFDRVLAPEEIAACAAGTEALRGAAGFTSDTFVLRPISDTAWFTFRHPAFGRRHWTFRMPEHMYYDVQNKRSHIPYGVRWQVAPDRSWLKFRCGLPEETKRELGLDFWGEVNAKGDALDFALRVKNVGDKRWVRQHMGLFCLQCGRAEGFRDYDAKRTFVRLNGEFTTMHEVVHGQFKPHRMCGVSVARAGGKGSDRLAVRVSEDQTSLIAIAADRATSLSFNFQDRIACLHSNPSWGLLKTGEQATAKGKIYLMKGMLGDVWQRYREDFGGR